MIHSTFGFCQSKSRDLFQIITLLDNIQVPELAYYYGTTIDTSFTENYSRGNGLSGSRFRVSFKDEKIQSYSKTTRTPSNRMYDYIEYSVSHSYVYTNNYLIDKCAGESDTIFIDENGKYMYRNIVYTSDTTAYRVIVNNDSILYIFSIEHIRIRYPWESDVRNIEVFFDSLGRPAIVNISDPRDRRRYYFGKGAVKSKDWQNLCCPKC